MIDLVQKSEFGPNCMFQRLKTMYWKLGQKCDIACSSRLLIHDFHWNRCSFDILKSSLAWERPLQYYWRLHTRCTQYVPACDWTQRLKAHTVFWPALVWEPVALSVFPLFTLDIVPARLKCISVNPVPATRRILCFWILRSFNKQKPQPSRKHRGSWGSLTLADGSCSLFLSIEGVNCQI